jgi:hypothetical protein
MRRAFSTNRMQPGGAKLENDLAPAGHRIWKRLIGGWLTQNIDDGGLHGSTSIRE